MDENRILFKESIPVSFNRSEDDLFEVSGWAVHTGIFKNETVQIPESELENGADTLAGKQLRKDHSWSIDSVVGLVKDAKVGFDKDVGKLGIRYFGVIDDPKLEKKIQNGFVFNVSIGFELTPECSVCGEDFRRCPHWFDEAHVIARDIKCYELSFVAEGADGESTIEPGEQFEDFESFTAQFANKLDKNNSNIPDAPKLNYSVGAEQVDKNEIQVTVFNADGTQSTIVLDNNDKNGEKMTDKAKLEKQLQEALAAKEKAEKEAKEMATEVESLKKDIKDGEGVISTLSSNVEALLEDKKIRDAKDAENAKATKQALCKEIADEELVRGSLTQDKYEDRIAELAEKDEASLGLVRDAIKAIPKKSQEGEDPKIGKFDNEDGEGMKVKMTNMESMEFDMEDKDLRNFMFFKAFNYPKHMIEGILNKFRSQ